MSWSTMEPAHKRALIIVLLVGAAALVGIWLYSRSNSSSSSSASQAATDASNIGVLNGITEIVPANNNPAAPPPPPTPNPIQAPGGKPAPGSLPTPQPIKPIPVPNPSIKPTAPKPTPAPDIKPTIRPVPTTKPPAASSGVAPIPAPKPAAIPYTAAQVSRLQSGTFTTVGKGSGEPGLMLASGPGGPDESLHGMASMLYGADFSAEQLHGLEQANGLGSGESIYPGQILQIPGGTGGNYEM